MGGPNGLTTAQNLLLEDLKVSKGLVGNRLVKAGCDVLECMDEDEFAKFTGLKRHRF